MQKLFLAILAVVGLTFHAVASDGYTVGSSVSDFSLKSTKEKTVSLADYKDAKGFIITFTCNHCPYAKAYEDRIINPNDAVQYPEDNFDNMEIRAKEKGFTFPYLYDESQEQAKKFGAIKTPHMYVLQKDGSKLTVKYIGAIDDNWEDAAAVKEKYVEAAVDALLAGKPVAITSTKAIGCGIKWKK